MQTSPLTAEEQQAWRAFLRAHAAVLRQLEADLTSAGLSMAEYGVLVSLSEAPSRRVRMAELAERSMLSRSGLTRLIDRLVREGLVRREACPSDARGMFAVLCDAGLQRLEAAWPTHVRGVREHFIEPLGAAGVATMTPLMERVAPQAAAVPPDCDGQFVATDEGSPEHR